VEVSVRKIGEHFAGEELQEVMHIFCCSETGRWKWCVLVRIAEAYTGRLVDEDDVGVLAPAILVVDGSISVFV